MPIKLLTAPILVALLRVSGNNKAACTSVFRPSKTKFPKEAEFLRS